MNQQDLVTFNLAATQARQKEERSLVSAGLFLLGGVG
jgi:hypothetical protein